MEALLAKLLGEAISGIVMGMVNAFFKRFTINRDQAIGSLEADAKVKDQELKNVQDKNAINNAIDTADDAKLERMRGELNQLDK